MTHLLSEGGPTFMYPILILLIISILLFIRGIKKNSTKNLNLLKSIGLFTLAYGMLGFAIGLINLFDAIPPSSKIAPDILGGGIKMSTLPPTFGLFTFLVGRGGIILLIGLKKE